MIIDHIMICLYC